MVKILMWEIWKWMEIYKESKKKLSFNCIFDIVFLKLDI